MCVKHCGVRTEVAIIFYREKEKKRKGPAALRAKSRAHPSQKHFYPFEDDKVLHVEKKKETKRGNKDPS